MKEVEDGRLGQICVASRTLCYWNEELRRKIEKDGRERRKKSGEDGRERRQKIGSYWREMRRKSGEDWRERWRKSEGELGVENEKLLRSREGEKEKDWRGWKSEG